MGITLLESVDLQITVLKTRVAMMSNMSLLVAPEVVVMTTYCVDASVDKIGSK